MCPDTVASTVALIFESVSKFSNEWKYVWNGPQTRLKWVYIYTRYSSLLFQIVNTAFAITYFNQLPVSQAMCHQWHQIQTSVALTYLNLLEALLMLRVYEMYNKSRTIGIIFTCSFLTEIVINYFSTILPLRNIKLDVACRVTELFPPVFFHAGAIILQQTLIWTLAFMKRKKTAGVQNSVTSLRLIEFTLWDGTAVFICIGAMLLSSLPFLIFIYRLAQLIYAISIPTYAAFICRIICNMERRNVDEPTPPESHELAEI
ncbi:hypothetical protein AMATHDRAFT_3245 [Amanita thiersii Skay4041]|uniref:DUF6533 domain-containing protein n=1 Tax=Amanita thiersii Skay4041 TaxID=703135 RepID=A0A2A9NSG2_9AGAR|nr:hypothetical protein AMATHDRAFT_3245 [Amanita thiersii Skay4041]